MNDITVLFGITAVVLWLYMYGGEMLSEQVSNIYTDWSVGKCGMITRFISCVCTDALPPNWSVRFHPV